ncbi:MAG: hypothetical protein KDG89_04240 [Geminicoccaceae bacterium]|nr:hypothetical protein [Geminicoccaceae bacterium]
MPAEALQAIVDAFSAGAIVAASGAGYAAVQDAYTGLKGLVSRKFASLDVAALEKDPARESRKQVLAEEIEAAGVVQDEEALGLVESPGKALLQAQPRDASDKMLIDLRNIKAGHSIILKNLKAVGGGIRVDGAKAVRNFKLHDTTATDLAEDQAGNR